MRRLAPSQLIGANFCFQHYPFSEVARLLGGLGMREIELWGVAQHLDLFHSSDARVELVRRVLADHGLSTWCFTAEQVLYPINIASGDEELRTDSIARFCRAADICAVLGARYLFLTSGRGYETECLLEPLQRVEINILSDAKGLRRMLENIGADNMDVVLDTVAMVTAGDSVADYFSLFGSRLAHVQIVDGTPAGHLIWGDGILPLGRHVGELAEAGYAGKITFEPFGNGSYALDPVAAWKRNLAAIEPYLDRASVSA